MPFLFLIAGIVMIISAVRGTNDQLVSLLKDDFTGKGNFIYWSLAILAIGSIGYIQELKPVSRAFLVLIVVVLVLDNRSVFAQFVQAVSTTQSVNAGKASTPLASASTNQLGTLTNIYTETSDLQF